VFHEDTDLPTGPSWISVHLPTLWVVPKRELTNMQHLACVHLRQNHLVPYHNLCRVSGRGCGRGCGTRGGTIIQGLGYIHVYTVVASNSHCSVLTEINFATDNTIPLLEFLECCMFSTLATSRLPLESTAKVHSGTTDEANYKCLASQHLYG